MNPVSEKSPAPSAAVALSGRGARASLEEADTHIQPGSCQANAYDDAKTANYSDHVHSGVNLRFGNGRRGDFGNRFHVTLQIEPLRRGLPVQNNFKEFMENCRVSLILPENAPIIARK